MVVRCGEPSGNTSSVSIVCSMHVNRDIGPEHARWANKAGENGGRHAITGDVSWGSEAVWPTRQRNYANEVRGDGVGRWLVAVWSPETIKTTITARRLHTCTYS
jgi:hypothetical protein